MVGVAAEPAATKPRKHDTRGSRPVLTRWNRAWASIVDASLVASIVLAPVAGGSSHVLVLLALAPLAAIAYGGTIAIQGSSGRRIHLIGLPVVLGLLALATALQIVPLPESILALLSPKAAEIRDFVGDGLSWRPISYEPGATAREAAKLMILAMIGFAAFERSRNYRRFPTFASAVVFAALASAAIAVVHRLVGADRMLGLLPSRREADTLMTTFVNNNHAAGFMVLAAMTSIGLAMTAKTERAKAGYFFASLALIGVSVLCFSRGGLLALAIGTAVLLGLLAWRDRLKIVAGNTLATAGLLGAVLVGTGAAVVAWRFEAIVHEFGAMSDRDPLGIQTKLAAMKDAWPMIFEHLWVGIGRGSYVSVYPTYKTYPHQYTFTHAENFVTQFASDWGFFLGTAAAAALVVGLVIRVLRTDSPIALGALAGAVALVTQNLVDFSLEMLGVAIPLVALLAGMAAGVLGSKRVGLDKPLWAAVTAAVPIGLLGIFVTLAFTLGDLEADVQRIRAEINARVASQQNEPAKAAIERLRPIAARHPSSSVITAQFAYLAEVAKPPDLTEAIHWANKTLFLAPTYADGHLLAGRVLARAGHRKQGFTEIRTAWESASRSVRSDAYIQEAIAWARSADELALAIPRKDVVLDKVDDTQLTRLLRVLRAEKKEDWAQDILVKHADPESADPSALLLLARECLELKQDELAAKFLARRRAEAPRDERAAQLLIELALRHNRLDEAEQSLTSILAEPGVDRLPFLRLKVDVALRKNQVDQARDHVEDLRNAMSPTHTNQIMLARLEAKVETAAERPGRAIEALTHAIQLAPSSGLLRLERARLLLRQNRPNEARSDLEIAVRAEPELREAQKLLADITARPTENLP